jgi:hypothetical protein
VSFVTEKDAAVPLMVTAAAVAKLLPDTVIAYPPLVLCGFAPFTPVTAGGLTTLTTVVL